MVSLFCSSAEPDRPNYGLHKESLLLWKIKENIEKVESLTDPKSQLFLNSFVNVSSECHLS
jgi:hypothetical protein